MRTDDTAERLDRSVSVRAFATGTDVYLAKGEYSPGSADGERPIAHELAHIVQQRGAPSSGPLTVSNPATRSRPRPTRSPTSRPIGGPGPRQRRARNASG